jgi:hypothetical protein
MILRIPSSCRPPSSCELPLALQAPEAGRAHQSTQTDVDKSSKTLSLASMPSGPACGTGLVSFVRTSGSTCPWGRRPAPRRRRAGHKSILSHLSEKRRWQHMTICYTCRERRGNRPTSCISDETFGEKSAAVAAILLERPCSRASAIRQGDEVKQGVASWAWLGLFPCFRHIASYLG